MGIKIFLALFSGFFWSIVYIDAIRIGFKQKTFAIPFWALALNIAWELLCSIFGYLEVGFNEQIAVNIVWFIFDIFIVISYFKFGKEEGKFKSTTAFYLWSFSGILASVLIQYLFILEFGVIHGFTYAAFLQNLLMSILFIDLLHKRQSSKGQSMLIAVSKCLGTIAPTILFGIVGIDRMGGPNSFTLGLGAIILIFDIIYIYLLSYQIKLERNALKHNLAK